MQIRTAKIENTTGITLENIKEKNNIRSVTLPTIDSLTSFEHKGDVTVESNIGENSWIKINNGMLVVIGNVENNTCIRLNHEPIYISHLALTGDITIQGVKETVNKTIHIQGSVGDNVTIFNLGDILIDGNIGSRCSFTSKNGCITISGSKGENNIIKTFPGTTTIMAKNGYGSFAPLAQQKTSIQNQNNDNEKQACRLF